MAKKSRKRLGQDLRVKDVLLLDRPEVEIIEVKEAKKEYRQSPKGSKVFITKDKATGQISNVFALEDDKFDVTKRPGLFDKVKKWLDKNHKKYQTKVTKDAKVIPPIMR